jgi:hypothetical protein
MTTYETLRDAYFDQAGAIEWLFRGVRRAEDSICMGRTVRRLLAEPITPASVHLWYAYVVMVHNHWYNINPPLSGVLASEEALVDFLRASGVVAW